MREQHSITIWTYDHCARGSEGVFRFQDEEAWIEHMEQSHSGGHARVPLTSLSKLCQVHMLKPVDCPVCGHKVEEPHRALDSHLEKHLLSFAMQDDDAWEPEDDGLDD
jgi:hypothetical protein